MNVESLTLLNHLLDEVLDLPPADRLRAVDDLSPRYPHVWPRLRRLLDDSAWPDVPVLGTIPKIDRTDDEYADRGRDDVAATSADDPLSVGPYRIVRKLAGGGMGEVYLAERADGMLNRPVALKLPRGAWCLSGFADRMAREREILASLSHPNIARLYDAGVTSMGQPYLALEYVEGCPIDEYVKADRLPVHTRLRVFLQVARAVAHAHAKLVIHRDLKPANILVTDAGDVKLLDFGIAKLIGEGSAEAATITTVAGCPLTPDYASPEQLAGKPLGVATDVYSLGVLLYELLAGQRPYSLPCGARLPLDEAILRIDPRRPSEVTADPAVRRLLRGDLDTIVLQALEKEPDKRYATVDAMAEDLERYLKGHPVLARPTTLSYRVRKFVGRNWLVVSGAVMLVCLLTASGVMTVVQAARVSAERDRARSEQAKTEQVVRVLVELFESTNPAVRPDGDRMPVGEFLGGAKMRALAGLQRAPEVRARLKQVFGLIDYTRGQYAPARTALEEALAEQRRQLGPEHPDALESLHALGVVLHAAGDGQRARVVLEESLERHRGRFGEVHEKTGRALDALARVEADTDVEKSGVLIRRALDVRRRVLPGNHPDLASTIGALGTYHEHRGEFDRARILLQEAIAVFKTPAERHHPKAIALMGEYASLLGSLNANRENEVVLRDAISLARATLGTDTITTADLINDLGVSLAMQGRHAEAEAAFREAFQPHLRLAGEHHWRTRNMARNVGRVLALQQRYAEALPWLDRAIAAQIPTEPADDAGRMGIRAQRAAVWFRLGHQDAAIAELTRIVEALPKARNAQSDTVEAWTRILLARALNDAGHPARAEQALLPARKWFERYEPSHPRRAEVACELGRARILQHADGVERASLARCLADYRRWGLAEPEVVASIERVLATPAPVALQARRALVP